MSITENETKIESLTKEDLLNVTSDFIVFFELLQAMKLDDIRADMIMDANNIFNRKIPNYKQTFSSIPLSMQYFQLGFFRKTLMTEFYPQIPKNISFTKEDSENFYTNIIDNLDKAINDYSKALHQIIKESELDDTSDDNESSIIFLEHSMLHYYKYAIKIRFFAIIQLQTLETSLYTDNVQIKAKMVLYAKNTIELIIDNFKTIEELNGAFIQNDICIAIAIINDNSESENNIKSREGENFCKHTLQSKYPQSNAINILLNAILDHEPSKIEILNRCIKILFIESILNTYNDANKKDVLYALSGQYAELSLLLSKISSSQYAQLNFNTILYFSSNIHDTLKFKQGTSTIDNYFTINHFLTTFNSANILLNNHKNELQIKDGSNQFLIYSECYNSTVHFASQINHYRKALTISQQDDVNNIDAEHAAYDNYQLLTANINMLFYLHKILINDPSQQTYLYEAIKIPINLSIEIVHQLNAIPEHQQWIEPDTMASEIGKSINKLLHSKIKHIHDNLNTNKELSNELFKSISNTLYDLFIKLEYFNSDILALELLPCINAWLKMSIILFPECEKNTSTLNALFKVIASGSSDFANLQKNNNTVTLFFYASLYYYDSAVGEEQPSIDSILNPAHTYMNWAHYYNTIIKGNSKICHGEINAYCNFFGALELKFLTQPSQSIKDRVLWTNKYSCLQLSLKDETYKAFMDSKPQHGFFKTTLRDHCKSLDAYYAQLQDETIITSHQNHAEEKRNEAPERESSILHTPLVFSPTILTNLLNNTIFQSKKSCNTKSKFNAKSKLNAKS